jgi:hypothetical protein
MPPILRLEYACTNAEMQQAQSLNLRKQLGGGSKWRTRLVLMVLLVGMLLGGWFRFREIPEGYRALLLATVVGGSVLFVFCKRKFRKSVPRTTQLEISEEHFTILGPDSKVTMPWSAFSACLESPDLFVLLDRPKTMLFVVPKRAFPSEHWQTWFREQAFNGASLTTPARSELPVPAPSTFAEQVTLTVHLGFRDYLARTLASWQTWGICLAVAGLLLGASLYAAAEPPPDAVRSATEVFLMFALPFFLVSVTMVILISSVHAWRSHARYTGPQEITLSEESVAFAGTDGSGTVPWTRFEHYKETPWSFILWRGSLWMMLPKRAFTSCDDLTRCRYLLERHLQQSRWFLG